MPNSNEEVKVIFPAIIHTYLTDLIDILQITTKTDNTSGGVSYPLKNNVCTFQELKSNPAIQTFLFLAILPL